MGLFRGLKESLMVFIFMYSFNGLFLFFGLKSLPDHTKIPITSAITSIIFYTLDTWIKKIQFEGFQGRNELITGPNEILSRMSKSNTLSSSLAGLNYFFIKTVFLSIFQIQMMRQTNK